MDSKEELKKIKRWAGLQWGLRTAAGTPLQPKFLLAPLRLSALSALTADRISHQQNVGAVSFNNYVADSLS